MKLPVIPLDKANHFIYGQVIFLLVFIACRFLEFDRWAGHVATGVTCALAAGKEWYDSRHADRHTADTADFFGTAMGGVLAWVLTTV